MSFYRSWFAVHRSFPRVSGVHAQADPSTLTEKPSAGGADGGDEVEWGLFLRTPEDEQRTKREWEKEHKAWIEDQVPFQRRRFNMRVPDFFPRLVCFRRLELGLFCVLLLL